MNPKPIKLVIWERARPIKNNREGIIRGGKIINVANKSSATSLQAARWKLRSQFKQKPLDYRVELIVQFYYENARVPDTDNALNFVYDALKGIVVIDDKPKYIGRTVLEDIIITRGKLPKIEVTLTKCQTTWKQITTAKH